jgi:hypothetical protein
LAVELAASVGVSAETQVTVELSGQYRKWSGFAVLRKWSRIAALVDTVAASLGVI